MPEPTNLARHLRRRSADAEQRLWRHLRDRRLAGYKFRRQRPVGRFVADFICMERRLVVEVDGGQHDWKAAADRRRTAALNASGYRVIRFWNSDVLGNTEGVLQRILEALEGED
jgi:very-short-patch-repair endonuclease